MLPLHHKKQMHCFDMRNVTAEGMGYSFDEMVASVPEAIKQEVDMGFAISNKIYDLMCKRGLSKKDFAKELGRRPGEVTKWLSGQYNFSIKTLAMLSAFFGESLIMVK